MLSKMRSISSFILLKKSKKSHNYTPKIFNNFLLSLNLLITQKYKKKKCKKYKLSINSNTSSKKIKKIHIIHQNSIKMYSISENIPHALISHLICKSLIKGFFILLRVNHQIQPTVTSLPILTSSNRMNN